MGWEILCDEVIPDQIQKYTIAASEGLLSFASVISLWQSSTTFRKRYADLLGKVPYKSYYWEHPPLTLRTLEHPYEVVFVSSDILHTVTVTPKYFDAYYKADGEIVIFQNLGGDAILVVPSPLEPLTSYAHLARFVRQGNQEQIHAYLSAIGKTVQDSLGESPIWLSTSGLGVYYVHVRLDSRPKYYTYAPYKH